MGGVQSAKFVLKEQFGYGFKFFAFCMKMRSLLERIAELITNALRQLNAAQIESVEMDVLRHDHSLRMPALFASVILIDVEEDDRMYLLEEGRFHNNQVQICCVSDLP